MFWEREGRKKEGKEERRAPHNLFRCAQHACVSCGLFLATTRRDDSLSTGKEDSETTPRPRPRSKRFGLAQDAMREGKVSLEDVWMDGNMDG
jgi:hypothetical protein